MIQAFQGRTRPRGSSKKFRTNTTRNLAPAVEVSYGRGQIGAIDVASVSDHDQRVGIGSPLEASL